MSYSTCNWCDSMFKYGVLTTAYDSLNDLLEAISDNLAYAYGVTDWMGDIKLASFTTKKTTESEAVTTPVTVTPSIRTMSDMIMETGYVALVTGSAGGSPALAYVARAWSNFTQTVADNLNMLAEALGYSEWFVAPQFTTENAYIGAGTFPYCSDYVVGLSGESSPFSMVVAASSRYLPVFCLSVPANPPHAGNSALWTQATDIDALIDYVRENPGFDVIRRYYGQDTKQHIVLPQRHYITDLENIQDVLRQISLANASDADDVAAAVLTEATSRLAADRAIRDTIDSVAIFGNTFKQVVERDSAMNQYIPRP